jgi:hypothetical protein
MRKQTAAIEPQTTLADEELSAVCGGALLSPSPLSADPSALFGGPTGPTETDLERSPVFNGISVSDIERFRRADPQLLEALDRAWASK